LDRRLHVTPANEVRRNRAARPVTALWVWGGGPISSGGATALEPKAPTSNLVFGDDAYVRGLCNVLGTKLLPLPSQLADVFGYPEAHGAVLVVEIAPLLNSNPRWTLFDALMQIDRNFVTPSLQALADRELEQLTIVANDQELTARARDRLKLWRRPRPGLSGLQ